jgi:hypothetical protein
MSDEIHYHYITVLRVTYKPVAVPWITHSFRICEMLALYGVPAGRYHNAQRLSHLPTDVYEFLYFPNIISLPIEE